MENDAMEPEYDRMVHVALKALRERPVYLAYVIFIFLFSIYFFSLPSILFLSPVAIGFTHVYN